MDRAGGLALLTSSTIAAAYTEAGRLLTDVAAGFGPAIDRALRRLGIAEADWEDDDAIPDDQVLAFEALAHVYALDVVLPWFALQIDEVVDQPMSNLKASQMYVNLAKERARWAAAAADTGYGPGNLAFTRWNLDFNEPSDMDTVQRSGLAW
jgi:hypothetical protein